MECKMMITMRKIHYIIAVLIAAVASGCAPIFEESYDSLKLDYTEFSVAASAEKALVSIYYSGAWEASLTDGTTWAKLEKVSGNGITQNRILFVKNTGPVRKTVLTITADNGSKWTVDVTQKGSSDAYLKFESNNIQLPADALTIEVPFVTTMGDDYVLPMIEGFVTEDVASVVTDYQISETEEVEEGTYRRMVSLTLAENQTGAEREISLPMQITSADGTIYGEALKVSQDAQKAYISAPEKCVVNKNEAQHSYSYEHNLGFLSNGLELTITYSGQSQDFIENATLAADLVKFDVSSTDVDRSAEIKIEYVANGLELSAVTEFVQVVNLLPRTISVDDFLALFTEGSTTYTPADLYTDNVQLYVVGGSGNPNMAQNINTAANSISTDENDRTVYMQDAASGATQGFRIRFADAENNTVNHGDLVQLSLEGCVLKKESSPERYTIENVTSANITEISTGNEIVPNVRSIASLSAADVYTYCTLENVEFQVKEGAYTNVREYAAIQNPLSCGLSLNYGDTGRANGNLLTAAQFAMDGAANLLYDQSGAAIYALINMGCDWRRSQVPAGAGDVSGVIVHQEMPRWGGNIGTYSIRPLDKLDFNMSAVSQWNTLAEWVMTKGTTDEKSYSWKHGVDNADGYSGTKASTLTQNKLCATNGASALIYSENLDGRTTGTYLHGKGATPVSVEYGYRGLDVTSPSSAETFGMTKGSAITFWGNPSGWFKDGVSGNEGYNGIVMEFDTKSVSGSVLSVGFSIAAGYPNDSKPQLNIALQSSTSFPVYWTVEYSIDGGTTWTEVANEATSRSGFEMRSIPWTLDGTIEYIPNCGTNSKFKVETQSDTGFGYVPYRFNLPSSVFGKDKVMVRIRPTSNVIMSLNSLWNAGLASAGLTAVAQSAQKTNVNHGIVLEDVVIQYK